MSRFNSIPVIIKQYVEELSSNKNSDNVKFNYLQTLESIRDYCDIAIKDYNRKRVFKK